METEAQGERLNVEGKRSVQRPRSEWITSSLFTWAFERAEVLKVERAGPYLSSIANMSTPCEH